MVQDYDLAWVIQPVDTRVESKCNFRDNVSWNIWNNMMQQKNLVDHKFERQLHLGELYTFSLCSWSLAKRRKRSMFIFKKSKLLRQNMAYVCVTLN